MLDRVHVLAHGRIEDLRAAAAQRFGAIHRRVGVAQDLLRAAAVGAFGHHVRIFVIAV